MARKKAKTKSESIVEVVQLLERIEAKESEVGDATRAVEELREALKTGKGVQLNKISEMRELIRTRKRWAEEAKRQPLFNQPKPATTDAKADRLATVAAEQTELSLDWRQQYIARLCNHGRAIAAKHIGKLADAGISTLGELADRMDNMGSAWAIAFRWGDKVREAIEDALAAIRATAEIKIQPAAAG